MGDNRPTAAEALSALAQLLTAADSLSFAESESPENIRRYDLAAERARALLRDGPVRA